MNKKSSLILIIGLLLLSVVVVVLAKNQANERASVPATSESNRTAQNEDMDSESTAEIGKEIVKTGEGIEAEAGKQVSVHYVGTLENGTKFDSSRDRGEPFTFTLGAGQVIEGWDEGVAGMKVGEVRKLTIPPSKGYGATSNGSIPANSTLIFEVELLDVK